MGCIFSKPDDGGQLPPGSYDLTPILHLPVIFVSGVPGAGKQSIAATISQLTGYRTIRPEDLEREEAKKESMRGRIIAEKLEEDQEIPEQLTLDLIKEAMLENQDTRGYILVGFPKNPRLSSLFNKQVKCPEKVVSLEVDNEVAAERLQGKLSELGKPVEDMDTVRQLVKEAASKVKTAHKRFGASIIMVNSSANPNELRKSLKELLSENIDHSQKAPEDIIKIAPDDVIKLAPDDVIKITPDDVIKIV